MFSGISEHDLGVVLRAPANQHSLPFGLVKQFSQGRDVTWYKHENVTMHAIQRTLPHTEIDLPRSPSHNPFCPQQLALVDPLLCMSLSNAQTVAMALTVLSACVDALVAWELGASAGAFPKDESHRLLELGTRGIRCVREGLPGAIDGSKSALARELLCVGSVCAGQLSVVTPAPPTQVLFSWV